jgi:hypothetical protein
MGKVIKFPPTRSEQETYDRLAMVLSGEKTIEEVEVERQERRLCDNLFRQGFKDSEIRAAIIQFRHNYRLMTEIAEREYEK